MSQRNMEEISEVGCAVRGEPHSHLLHLGKQLTLGIPSCFHQQAEHCMDDPVQGEKNTLTENSIKAEQEDERKIQF